MSFFASSVTPTGWAMLPNGLLIQWLTVVSSKNQISGSTIDKVEFDWPIAFPNNVFTFSNSAKTYVQAVRSIEGVTKTGATLLLMAHTGNVANQPATAIIAIGY